MSNAPSFFSLFRRSRFARDGETDQSVESRQNRRENYAVAAVAFAVKHDIAFRLHFLDVICGLAVQDGAIPSVEIEPFHHSDLAIKDSGGKWLAIVEFKRGATLREKQNPSTPAFFGGEGYGTLILREPSYQSFAQKHYAVVDDARHFDDGQKRCIDYRSRTWGEFSSPSGTESGLWADLIFSLGELGVAAFQFRKLKGMNNLPYTTKAVAMHQILDALAAKLKLGSSGGWDINVEGDEMWYGRKFSADRLMNHIFLRAAAGSDSKGWFGYSAGQGHQELSVWFYCESEEAARNTAEYIRLRLKTAPLGDVEVHGKNVSLLSSGIPMLGDGEWFEAVWKALDDDKMRTKK